MDAASRARRVLMLCYYFPPISSAGTHRSVGFARRLREFGWRPVVLTVERSRIRWEPQCEEVPPDVDVARSFEWNLHGALTVLTGLLNRSRDALRRPRRPSPFFAWCLPDPQVAWLSTIRGILLARRCDCVYASCSPFSSALSGCLIKLATGRPLVLDFRDPWALNPHSNHGPRQKRVLARMEAWAVRRCDALILNTPGAERLYRWRYPAQAHKMTCIPNGFDEVNAEHVAAADARFTIMHVGDFYRSRTPERLLQALVRLGNPEIEFVQVGPWCDVLERYTGQVPIRHIERVAHRDALALMQTASLLFLAQGWEDGVTDYVSVASKTYEYLAAGVPVLAEVPPGDNADIIRRYAQRGWVVTSPTADAVLHAVEQAYAQRAERAPKVSPEFLQMFDRRRLTSALAAVFDHVVAPSPNGDVPAWSSSPRLTARQQIGE